MNAVCVKKSCTICDVPNVFIDIIKVFLLSNYLICVEKRGNCTSKWHHTLSLNLIGFSHSEEDAGFSVHENMI